MLSIYISIPIDYTYLFIYNCIIIHLKIRITRIIIISDIYYKYHLIVIIFDIDIYRRLK